MRILRTNNGESHAGEWLASMPFPFIVVEGDEVRDAVARLAERFRAAVAEGRMGP